jgi:sulfonate transport system substrate-binding protein
MSSSRTWLAVVPRKGNHEVVRWCVHTPQIVGVLAIALIVGGCRSKPRPLRVAVNSTAVASAPVFVAGATGAFDKLGFPVQDIPRTSGREALTALLTGDADIATVAETPIVLQSGEAAERGPITDSLRVLAVITVSEYRVVASRSAGISNPGDLRGKRIGTLKGTSAEYFLVTFLQNAQVSPDSVTIVNVQPPSLPTALRRGDVDAISIWEPQADRAAYALGDSAISFDESRVYLERFLLVTRASVLRDREDDLRAFVRVVMQASAGIAQQPESAMRIVSVKLGMTTDELRRIWPRFSFPTEPDSALAPAMTRVDAWRLAGHQPPRSPEAFRTMIDFQFLELRQ